MKSLPGAFLPSVPWVSSVPLCACLLAFIFMPRLSAAAVVVAEPTGDADPAFLAELKASLETVVSETAPEVDAELQSSATVMGEGVELVVEIVPSGGGEPVRETRVASRASAPAQARAMVRAAIKVLIAPKPEAATATQKTVPPPVEPPKPHPPPPPLSEKYHRRAVMLWTALPTTILISGTWILGIVGLTTERPLAYAVGAVPAMGAAGLVFPTIGYFYIGQWKHALLMTGIRAALIGVAVVADVLWVQKGFRQDEIKNQTCKDSEEGCHHEPNYSGAVPSCLLLGLMSIVAIVDSFMVGGATDKVNDEYRKSLAANGASRRPPQVAVAPLAWSSGHGDGTFGLAVGGAF
jgi:hypothetical protein